jgi:hypothetical protein
VLGTTNANTTPITTTRTAPPSTYRPDRPIDPASRFAMPNAIPMIGVDSGAMIIAPITVAVESDNTPAQAMIDESVSIVQNADRLAAVSPADRSKSSVRSSSVRRCACGRTRLITPIERSSRYPPPTNRRPLRRV